MQDSTRRKIAHADHVAQGRAVSCFWLGVAMLRAFASKNQSEALCGTSRYVISVTTLIWKEMGWWVGSHPFYAWRTPGMGVNGEFDKKATKHSVFFNCVLLKYGHLSISIYISFFFIYVKSIGSVFSRLNRERCLCTLVRSRFGILCIISFTVLYSYTLMRWLRSSGESFVVHSCFPFVNYCCQVLLKYFAYSSTIRHTRKTTVYLSSFFRVTQAFTQVMTSREGFNVTMTVVSC